MELGYIINSVEQVRLELISYMNSLNKIGLSKFADSLLELITKLDFAVRELKRYREEDK